MCWAILKSLSYHLFKESIVIMSEDKRLSTGQGIVVTVFPIAGAVIGHIVNAKIAIDDPSAASVRGYLFCIVVGGFIGTIVAWLLAFNE